MNVPKVAPPGALAAALAASFTSLFLAACDGESSSPKADRDQDAAADMAQDMNVADLDPNQDMRVTKPACPSPITLATSPAYAIPLGLIAIKPQGGSGRYQFSLTKNDSGAILNELTGAYLAGVKPKTEDEVLIQDLDCDGHASLTVNVVAPMIAQPQEVELEPKASFTVAVTEGSGDLSFSFEQNLSGATIDPSSGAYVAGDNLGTDRVLILDNKTGQSATATVHVVAQARFAPTPPTLFLATGQTFPLKTIGGSGVIDATADNAAVTIQDDLIIAGDAPGLVTLSLKDRFIDGLSATQRVHVVAPQDFPQRLDGDQNGFNRFVANVDINGDGHLDAVLGHPEANVNAYRSGAVYIYEGSAQGLKPTPSRVISGQDYAEELGQEVRVADLDGDAIPELIVSARLADLGAVDAGAVFIYKGQAGKLFADEATQTWSGGFSGDQLGYSFAVCDFNGDQRPDLVVGAPFNEDRDAQPVVSNQGSIKVFLNYDSGWLPKPDQHIYGKIFDDQGQWSAVTNMNIGLAVDVGDFDGDGLCDAFVATNSYSSGRGAVFVYRGKAPDMLGPGGLEDTPSLAISMQDPAVNNPQFGRRIAAGDLNGDGKADLVIGAYAWEADNSVSSLRDQGAAFVVYGQALSQEPVKDYLPLAQLNLINKGDNGSDHYGWHVEVQDVNGDGVADAIINGRIDELQGGPGSAGTIFVHYGKRGEALSSTPDLTIGGAAGSDLLGQAFAAAGDLNKDGVPDLVAFAPRADRLGLDVGEAYWISTDALSTLNPLDIISNPSGGQQGRAVQIIRDLDGDGFPELAAGGIRQSPADPSTQTDAGLVHLYKGSATGFERMPAQTLGDFYTHSTTDFFGRNIASAGDFDKDGKPDLIVSAELEDAPSNYNNSSYANPDSCSSSSRGDSGALYIFRGSSAQDKLVEPTPAFILHGPESSDRIIQVIGDFDFNGDGTSDIAYSSYLWDETALDTLSNRGGLGIVFGGKQATADKITALCGPDVSFYGDRQDAHLGWSLARAGDIDDDGCDDLVVGARSHSESFGSQGQVRIYFGFGSSCASQSARFVALAPGVSNARAGAGVTGNQDLDGDNIPDLVVSADTYRVGADSVGAAWVLPGSYINSLPKEPACHEGQLGSTANTYSCSVCSFAQAASAECNPRKPANLRAFTPTGYPAPLLVTGSTPNEAFGTSVTMVPGAGPQGRALVAVGSPQSDAAGVPSAGGVSFFEVTGQGPATTLNPEPVARFGGEPGKPGSLLGEEVHAAKVGAMSMCVVGGTRSDAIGVDQGAAFALPFSAAP